MANQCWNYVDFQGRKEVLDKLELKFKEQQERRDTSLTKIMQNVIKTKLNKEQEEDSEFFNTRYWIYETDRVSDTLLTISGYSAWSPPIQLLEYITKDYDIDAYIEFQDWLVDLNGKMLIEKGHTVLFLDCTNDLIKDNGFKYIKTINLEEYKY